MDKNFISYSLIIFISLPILASEPDTAFNNQFRRDIGGWIAGDATFSILLPDGKTLWLFGDTFIGEVDENNAIKPGARMIRNSAVIQDGNQLETLHGGTDAHPDDFIPTRFPDSTWYWPEHGIVENDTLRIFLAEFRTYPDGPPGFNFEHAGNDIASFTWPDLEFINTVKISSYEMNGVIYGDRLLADSDYIYIYGRRDDIPDLNIAYPHAARAEKGNLMKQQWSFYDGDGWSADPMDTKQINNFQVSQQYSITFYRGKYILLTQDIWLSPQIWTFTSDSPVGPWQNKTLIYTTPESSDNVFTYNAYAHPQFNRDGQLLVSYNVNGEFSAIFNNVELYRPRFIRVPYMNLDYAFWPNAIRRSTDEKLDIQLWPNPANDLATLAFYTDVPGDLSVELRDTAGRLIRMLRNNYCPEGTLNLEIDMHRLPEGLYVCKVIFNRNSCILPLVKSSGY